MLDKAANGVRYIRQKYEVFGLWTGTLAGLLFLFGALFVTFDVIGRRYFSVSSAATDDIGGFIRPPAQPTA